MGAEFYDMVDKAVDRVWLAACYLIWGKYLLFGTQFAHLEKEVIGL